MKKTELDINHITPFVVFKMSIPIFVELLLQMLVGNVDQFMVSQVSQDAVAAVGNGDQIMKIIVMVITTMSAAATIVITQYIGAGNKQKISETCSTAIMFILAIGIAITVLVVCFNRQIFSIMQVPEEIMGEACLYMTIIGSCIFVQGLYLVMSAILRGFSLMNEVMVVSIIMNVMNIIGNAMLLYGWFGLPRMGIAGVAISTDISKCVGLILLFLLFKKKTNARIGLKYLKPFPMETLKKILGLAVPSGAEGLSYNLSQLVILGMVNTFGTAVITTKVYASMLANISYVYAVALAQATQIVMGYLLGANKKEEASQRVWYTFRICIAVCCGISLLLFLGSDWVFGIFTNNPEVLELGKKIFLIEIFLECGRAMNIILVRALCTTGDIQVPVVVGVIFHWSVAALLSYLFGIVFGFGLVGIWIAMGLDEFGRGVIFLFRFKSGAWKKKQLI
jgi:putative MATE family efflux protein